VLDDGCIVSTAENNYMEGRQMTFGTPPDPSYEKASQENEARIRVEDTGGMQAAQQAQRSKDEVASQAREASSEVQQAGSFLDRIMGWFRRN
jgi:hypothetical protein